MLLTGSQADIVQGQLGDSRVELKQQGQRLANATCSTQHGHLGQLRKKGGLLALTRLFRTTEAEAAIQDCRRQSKRNQEKIHTWRAEAEKARR